MRIISGKFKGRKLTFPPTLAARPTTDFAKTGLFNYLSHRYDLSQCNVLDLFSGTGNISIEFASREAASITSVDAQKAAIDHLMQISQKLQIHHLKAIQSDVLQFLQSTSETFDIIFADPPFKYPHKELIIQEVFSRSLLNKTGILVIEHGKNDIFEHLKHYVETRKYGNVFFSYFSS